MLISSIDNQKIKDLKKLRERKYRDKENLFLIEGEHLVVEAFKSGVLRELILVEDETFSLNIETTYLTKKIMKELSTLDTPTTIIGVCNKLENSSDLGNHILLLDRIQDPGNLGTIIRSAVAFNIDTIILGEGCVDLYNPKVLRATQGLMFHINIIIKDLFDCINHLKNDNYKILGTRVTEGTNLKEFKNPSKFALVMGNEGSGVALKIQKLCDEFICIKTNSNCESLNVSIACSIILYQLDK
ncbi:MAG: RNA methyltransferase [Bacilli bacterium]|nr:RNA methyltransferase [Bacilli bacterium]MDD4053487.1 RNA methyltransferase [Bacilli bacterium]MDD4411522.1 RNA methyltransferase [Bacilli bacterium]